MMHNDQFFDENPFANPPPVLPNYEAAATSRPPNPPVNSAGLENFQPFANQSQDMSSKPPGNADASQLPLTLSELEKRQRELDLRTAELNRREAEQQRISAEQARLAGPVNNFPPLPAFCPLKPCFYQAIDVEILPDHRPIVTLGFRIWFAYLITIVVNFFGAILYFASGQAKGGELFGMAIFATLICPPASYVCWFRPLYRAFKTNSSFSFFTFFFVMFAQCIVVFLQSMAFFNMGTCGLLYALSATSVGWLCGIMFLILLAILACGAAMVYLLIKVHGVFRNSGASFSKAKYEFMTGVASDATIRTVAAEAAVNSFGNGATAGAQQGPGKY